MSNQSSFYQEANVSPQAINQAQDLVGQATAQADAATASATSAAAQAAAAATSASNASSSAVTAATNVSAAISTVKAQPNGLASLDAHSLPQQILPQVLGITRAQIATSYMPAPIVRFYTIDDAPWVRGTSSDLRAIQDAGGQWWKIDLSLGYLDIRWFGAVADYNGTTGTDNTAAVNAAFTAATAYGVKVRAPGGFYYFTGALTLNITTDTATEVGHRPSLVGDGSPRTRFVFGLGNFNGLTINGSATGTGVETFCPIEGVRLDKTDGQGVGLLLNISANCRYVDVTSCGWQYGLLGVDVLSSSFDNCRFAWNSYGFTFERAAVSYPNAITFIGCRVGGNSSAGGQLLNPADFVWLGGSCEGNANFGILSSGGPQEGANSMSLIGVHFEGTTGTADVYITNSDVAGTYVFSGCSFLRVNATSYVPNNILISGTAQMRVSLRGCGFKGFNGYSPNVAHQYISNAGTNATLDFNEETNYVDSRTEASNLGTNPRGSYTVSALPTASASLQGQRTNVSDATSPSFLGTLTGGGSVKCPVFCNGAAWVAG